MNQSDPNFVYNYYTPRTVGFEVACFSWKAACIMSQRIFAFQLEKPGFKKFTVISCQCEISSNIFETCFKDRAKEYRL